SRSFAAIALSLSVACPAGVALAAATQPAATTPPAQQAQQPASAAINPQIAEKLLLANGYLENGKPDDALSVVDELLRVRKTKPVDRAQIHRFRGYILIAKGKVEDGGKEFEAALAENALD